MFLLIIAATLATCAARPRYIAMPTDQIAFVDLRNLRVRAPRQTLEPPPPPQLPQALYQNQDYLPAYQSLPIQKEYQVLETPENDYQPPQRQYQPVPIPIQGYAPIPIHLEPQQLQQKPAPKPEQNEEAATQVESRPPDFGEYVDFGAHTGDNGAFGWYADYPVNHYDKNYHK